MKHTNDTDAGRAIPDANDALFDDKLLRAGPMAVIETVAARHKLGLRDLITPSRRRPVVVARNAAIRAVAKAWPQLSSTELGAIFGMHHTSILHALGCTSASRRTRNAAAMGRR